MITEETSADVLRSDKQAFKNKTVVLYDSASAFVLEKIVKLGMQVIDKKSQIDGLVYKIGLLELGITKDISFSVMSTEFADEADCLRDIISKLHKMFRNLKE